MPPCLGRRADQPVCSSPSAMVHTALVTLHSAGAPIKMLAIVSFWNMTHQQHRLIGSVSAVRSCLQLALSRFRNVFTCYKPLVIQIFADYNSAVHALHSLLLAVTCPHLKTICSGACTLPANDAGHYSADEFLAPRIC